MNNKLLLLGHTGKMGIALNRTFKNSYQIIRKNTDDFDALDLDQVKKMVEEIEPDIVVNTVAFLGIDPCEQEPEKAFRMNTLYPKLLADLSRKQEFLFIHFSTDAVFNDEKNDFYVERDNPSPLNVYGFTKYGGDCFIKLLARNYYIFRIPILFGESIKNNQFVEKMFQRIRNGQKILNISDDIISSPSYSCDIAQEVKRIIEAKLPNGLYHIANSGRVTLYELMEEIVGCLNLDITLEKASYKDFPYIGIKNTNTPIRSAKTTNLRPFQEAIREYCNNLKGEI